MLLEEILLKSFFEHQEAFHGTRKEFDNFSIDFIGTGSGILTFGWGIYVTKNRHLANIYKDDKKKGLIYHVYIPDDDKMLVWELPFKDQPEHVKNSLQNLGYEQIRQKMIDEKQVVGYRFPFETDTGDDIYGTIITFVMYGLVDHMTIPYLELQKRASVMLLRSGIAGIKHYGIKHYSFDNKNEVNYVIFDPREIKIIKKTKK